MEIKSNQKVIQIFWLLDLRNHWKVLRRNISVLISYSLLIQYSTSECLTRFFTGIYKSFKMLLWWYYMHNLKRATDDHTGIYCTFSNQEDIHSIPLFHLAARGILILSQWGAAFPYSQSIGSPSGPHHLFNPLPCWLFLSIATARFSGHGSHREAWQRVEPNLTGLKQSPHYLAFLTHLQISSCLTLSEGLTLEQLTFQFLSDQTVTVGLKPQLNDKPPMRPVEGF